MRIKTAKTKKNGILFYVIKTYYDANGKKHSLTVEKLGNENDIRVKYNCDPDTWAKEYVAKLNKKEAEELKPIQVSFSPKSLISKNHQYSYNVGYLFLQSLYHNLGLHKICEEKSDFKSRPVYVKTENRIKAHFITCFLSLVIYRYLEKLTKHQYTCDQLIETLQNMNMREVMGEGYIL